MTTAETIFLGVVSGVLTSAAIIVFGQFFYRIFLPWYESITYKGVDISGEWTYKMEFPSGNKSNFFARFVQNGFVIKSTISESKTIVGLDKDEMRIFEYSGKLVDRFLTLTGRNTNKQSLGVYTFLLEIKGDGDYMEGSVSRYCMSDHIIKSDLIVWQRQ